MEQTKRLEVFAERFNKLRGKMSQAEFAEFLGLSRPTIGFYENGTRLPDALVLKQIAEKCGVTADYLLGLTDVPTNDRDLQFVCEYTGLSPRAISYIQFLICDMSNTSINPFLSSIFSNSLFTVLNSYSDNLNDAKELLSEANNVGDDDSVAMEFYDRSQKLLDTIDFAEYRLINAFNQLIEDVFDSRRIKEDITRCQNLSWNCIRNAPTKPFIESGENDA